MNNLKSARKQAAARHRRIIFNNDGDDIMKAVQPTTESFLAQRCEGLQGTHVDSVFYCSVSNFDRCRHDSRVGEVDFTDAYHKIYPELFGGNHVPSFVEQGTDGVRLTSQFCRRHGIEFFWSARMNDIHDNWHPPMWTEFKKAHPELRLWREGDYGNPGRGDIEPHMYYSAMDYGREDVRRRMFDIIIDVCERYDIDGIELDFMREPAYFRPTLEGRAVEAEHLKMMTAYVRSLREAIDEIALRKGRPILLGARVPNLPEACLYIGLDVEAWLRRDLLDLLLPSIEFTPFTGRIEEMVNLAHAYGIQAYPSISGSVGSVEGWAAASINVLSQGADGIATFNAFDPQALAWSIIGDSQAMAEVGRRHAIDEIRGPSTHRHVIDCAPLLPASFEGHTCTVSLPVREDLRDRAAGLSASLTLVIEGCAPGDDIELHLNGNSLWPEITIADQGCAPRAVGNITFVAQVDPALLVRGDNEISILLNHIEPRQGVSQIGKVELYVNTAEAST